MKTVQIRNIIKQEEDGNYAIRGLEFVDRLGEKNLGLGSSKKEQVYESMIKEIEAGNITKDCLKRLEII